MCESLAFRSVGDFNSALAFTCAYVEKRLNNLLQLYRCDKFGEFLRNRGLPTVNFQKVFMDFSSVFVALINCKGWEITVEELLDILENLGFEHVLWGLQKHFPEPVQRRIELWMLILKSEDERLNESLCDELFCIDDLVNV